MLHKEKQSKHKDYKITNKRIKGSKKHKEGKKAQRRQKSAKKAREAQTTKKSVKRRKLKHYHKKNIQILFDIIYTPIYCSSIPNNLVVAIVVMI